MIIIREFQQMSEYPIQKYSTEMSARSAKPLEVRWFELPIEELYALHAILNVDNR